MQNKTTNTDVNDLLFTRDWTKNLLDKIDASKTDGKAADMNEVMMNCSSICYRNKNMDCILEKIDGLHAFFKFITIDWNWKLTYDRATNVLLCDENKSECICPVVRACDGSISLSMCFCTEGMLKRIFEKIFQREVRTKLVTSVLRGGKSCVYEIEIDALSEDEMAFLSGL